MSGNKMEDAARGKLAVDTATAAEMLGIAPGTLANWRHAKGGPKGPRYSRIGNRIVYPVSELERYLAENMV